MTARQPKVRTELTVVELDGEAVVYDAESMDVHRFNPSATLILGLLDGSATLEELAVDVSDVFGQPLEEVQVQLDELIRQLDEGHILEPV